MLDGGLETSEFKLQLCYYVHVRTNNLGKSMNTHILSQLWVKLYHNCFSTRMALALSNPQRFICHKTKKPNHINNWGPNLDPLILIWSIEWTLTCSITPDQSGPGGNGNEGVLYTLQNWNLAIRCILVLLRTPFSWGGVLPPLQGTVRVF